MPSRPIPRAILKYYGGKFRVAPWIVAQLPPHRIYVEPFGGAASVLLSKPRAPREVYNDLHGDLVDLFRVLREPRQRARLLRLLRLTPYARAEYDRAFQPCDDPVERARRTLIRGHLSFASSGNNRRTGFGARLSGHPARAWAELPAIVELVGRRFAGILVEHRDAVEVMRRFDSPDALHYVDPPYLAPTRTSRSRMYQHELLDEAEHAALLDALGGLQGAVALSGYPSDLYRDRLAAWAYAERPALDGLGRRRTECLWLRPARRAP